MPRHRTGGSFKAGKEHRFYGMKRPKHALKLKENAMERIKREGEHMKRCPSCKILKSITDFDKNIKGRRGVQPYCNPCRRRQAKIWREKHKGRLKPMFKKVRDDLKKEVLAFYSENPKHPACRKCGIDDIDVLCIDHIHNDGGKFRKESKGGMGGANVYRWLRKNNFPEGHQTLCMNCNLKKELVKNRAS